MHIRIFQTILAIFRTLWRPISVFMGMSIVQTFLGNYSYVVFQQLIDSFPLARQFSDFAPFLVSYVAVNLANHLFIYVEGYPGTIIERGVIQWMKLRALEKIAHIDYLSYQNLGTGNLIQIIENGAEAIRKILTGFYLGTLSGAAQMIISLYFIQAYDPALIWAVLALFVIFYLTANQLMNVLHRVLERMLASQEDFSKFSVRTFMELVVFRINGRVKAEYERLQSISDEMLRAQAKLYLMQELSYTGLAVLIFLVEVGVVVQQTSRILAGVSTVGTLVALVWFVRQVFWPVIGFGKAWVTYKMDAVTFGHLVQVLDLPDDPGLGRGATLQVTRGQICFDHVTFAYSDQEVLRDFDLVIEAGKTTAIVGASGSGKSTLLRLLLQLLKPQLGQVRVDGVDLAQVRLESYYEQVAYIPQEPPIFDGTLRENLTFDAPIAPEAIADVLARVGLAAWARRLPDGLKTRVGERGIKLSGGERQRLAFGRMMLQDPKIVILDEPTSSLDSLTEAWVTHNLLSFLRGKTVIIVAHRLQTVRNADQIIALAEGQIAQRGNFEQLMAEEGLFRRLWEEQMQEGAANA